MNLEMPDDDDSDHMDATTNEDLESVVITTHARPLTVRVPRARPPVHLLNPPAATFDPFACRLPPPQSAQSNESTPAQHAAVFNGHLHPPQDAIPPVPQSGGPSSFDMMIGTAVPTTQGLWDMPSDFEITIFRKHAESYDPHSIPADHIFLNYSRHLGRTLYNDQRQGDILLVQKNQLLKDTIVPTNLDTYIILDPSNFVTDFTFTIDGLAVPPMEQGQLSVAKLVKDRLYASTRVWNFLHAHHDAIGPETPEDEIPAQVIMSLEVRDLWIEGRRGEPGRQGWNIWIVHPTKIASLHAHWLSALRPVFPIRDDSGFGGTAKLISVPFSCKGCKGTSHPTTLCPLKEQLGDILQRPRMDRQQTFQGCGRGGRGGHASNFNGCSNYM
ncbi:hypothetical protein IW261DRAFT_1418436 [Armillaria novae-zelandiae]|uniref:Uncharacterized protein n=1 Tax=Armillaria novae-zelandiae TaxID=153914 RepID=A0AA39UJF9_9AGAR|nr:hypothetical protein IW261DRAFT_1418436 [Armillaria novae-zelandiae]